MAEPRGTQTTKTLGTIFAIIAVIISFWSTVDKRIDKVQDQLNASNYQIELVKEDVDTVRLNARGMREIGLQLESHCAEEARRAICLSETRKEYKDDLKAVDSVAIENGKHIAALQAQLELLLDREDR